MRSRLGSTSSLALLFLAACASRSPAPDGDLLFDDRHAPTVLTEARTLAPPPDVGPNRLLVGWTGWRREGGDVWLLPREDARLELVELEPRPRRLVFDGEVLANGEAWVEIVSGEVRRRARLEDRFTVELPPAERSGRRVVEVRSQPAGAWALRAVAVEPALDGGDVECDEAVCRQSGPSILETVRRVAPGTRLSGVFVPPSDAGAEQGFRVVARAEDGSERTLFAWRPSWRDRLAGARRFEAEIAAEAEPRWTRLRFVAEGAGPPGEWRDLRLARPASIAPESSPEVPAAPRLIVCYVMDAMRADHVSAQGGESGLTPVIDRLVAEGAVFRHHRSPAPNTLPSTKTLFTGRTHLLRGGWKLAADGPPTLAEAFTAAGFRTGLFSGNGNVSADFGTDRGFEHVDASVLMGRPGYYAASPGYNDNAARVHRAALGWLSGLGADDRAFVYLHTIHPHAPYDPPPDLEERFTRGIDSTLETSARMLRNIGQGRYVPSDAERRRLARLYAGAVAYNDRELDRLLAGLAELYEPGEVLIVLTSDHGEELFDHGGVLHGYTLYEEQIHVPLVVWWPGEVAPRSVEVPTGTLDVHDGLRSLADLGFAADRPGFWRHLTGSGLVEEPEPWVQFAAASAVPGGIFSARTARWKLIWAPREGAGWGMGSAGGRTRDTEYLFDLTADREAVNRAGERDFEADWLRSRLAAWIDSGIAAEVGGEVPELDEAARERLRALGYLD